MKIRKIEMNNFCGYHGDYTVNFPEVGILMGANGTGKTSVLNAIRFALTGDKPDGDMIYRGEEKASVSLSIENDAGDILDITRVTAGNGNTTCYLGGKKITAKSLTTWIESFTKLPLDRVKVLSSQEVLSALSGADFGKFLLSYVGKKTPVSDIKRWVTLTPGIEKLLNENLPAEVGIENLDEFDFFLRDERKSVKKEISSLEVQIAHLADAPSGVTRDDIKDKISALREADKAYSVYLSKVSSYENCKRQIEDQDKRRKALIAQISDIKATEPDDAEKASIMDAFNSAKQSYDNNKTAWASSKAGKEALDKEIEAISSPGVCPLSRHVKCHEDMSMVRTELQDASSRVLSGMNALVIECNKAAETMKQLKEKASVWQENADRWNKKKALEKELEVLESASKVIPEKPDLVAKPDLTEEERLNGILKAFDEAERKTALLASLLKKKTYLSDTDYLIKTISDKGVIRENIVSSFLHLFEDECNKKCAGTPFEFRFTFDKGVVPEMKNSHGIFLTAAELSGGEKTFFYYVIISLLNSLTGTRILLLDELSVMDSKVFKGFLSLIEANKSDYDTVVLSCVDHPDSNSAVEETGISRITVLPSSEAEEALGEEEDKEIEEALDLPETEDDFLII